MNLGLQYALILAGLMVLGMVIERYLPKRNKRTRSGWRVTRPKVYDASCKSGWQATTQRGHRY